MRRWLAPGVVTAVAVAALYYAGPGYGEPPEVKPATAAKAFLVVGKKYAFHFSGSQEVVDGKVVEEPRADNWVKILVEERAVHWVNLAHVRRVQE